MVEYSLLLTGSLVAIMIAPHHILSLNTRDNLLLNFYEEHWTNLCR